jgi:hypothetical protein
MPRRPRTLLLLGLLFLLAACVTQQRWQHPTLAPEQWRLDQATCKARANRLIDTELARRDPGGAGEPSALVASFRAHDARKRREVFFARCLKDKGYRKVKEDKAA